MIEFAAHEVMASRELLAMSVRDALAAAGLPVVSPHMSPQLIHGGAEVRADKLADCHAPVRIDWHPHHELTEAAMKAGVDTPAFIHLMIVLEGMLRVMKEILSAEGFEARDSTNDLGPFGIEVLGRLDRTSGWTTSSLISSIDFQGPTS
ncbi:hypothetical protein QLQ12_25970 [Actinoplanes sp. NEAU-A12]|uniref:Uncharacterized protein n=1 Tax=Actinoplanes sandaracinus TaxID=3045177 RepID=A0ABT6WQQ2_9ACTN|nr:hypothetical protein [Actinoplanes sandaracinus]MDI6102071.1 hypothetical protein [Actinoplanes sandaracinus]